MCSLQSILIITAMHWMQGGLVRKKVSVRPSDRPSNALIVTKRKKNLSRFVYHAKDDLPRFSEKK